MENPITLIYIYTKETLLNDMKRLPNRFNFIQCLVTLSDKDNFIDKYLEILNSNDVHWKYYNQGFIKISTWLKIMHSIQLTHYYRVYRESYWGENTGIITQMKVPIKGGYKSLLVTFGNEYNKKVELVIDNKTITKVSTLRRSNHVNLEQGFWDSIMC